MVPTPHQKLLIQVCSKRTDEEQVLTLTLKQEQSLAMSCSPPVPMMTVTLILEMKVMLESQPCKESHKAALLDTLL